MRERGNAMQDKPDLGGESLEKTPSPVVQTTKDVIQRDANLIPLSTIRPREHARIRRIEAGHGLQARLASMGLLPGTEVRVVLNDRQGPLVVGVKEVRLMLGRAMADKVFVHRIGQVEKPATADATSRESEG